MATAKQASKARTSSQAASESVGRALHAEKRGTLRRGKQGHGGKVTSRAQAIAIGLNEAREAGADVPPPPAKRAGAKSGAKRAASKSAATRGTAKRSASAKRPAGKRSAATKGATKRPASKRAAAKGGAAKRPAAKRSGAKKTTAKRSR